MIYLIYGIEDFLIQKELTKIKKENNIETIQVSNYSLEETNIQDVLDDASTLSLFMGKKLIVCENAYIFTSTTGKEKEQNTKELEKYLENPNPDTILVFIVRKEKLDERKKIVKKFKEKKGIIECNKLTNIKQFIQSEIKPFEANSKIIQLLIDRVGDNLNILSQEIEKLKGYKDIDKVITEQDVLAITIKYIDTNIFTLIENIVNKDKKSALESYQEMIKLGEEPIKIMIMLANQFRIIYQARNLYKKGYSEKDIASNLSIHPYRIKLALEKGRSFTDQQLLNYLDMLADLDIGIKTGTVHKEMGLELFILKV